MIRTAITLAAAAALGGCGIAHADRINQLSREQLVMESDQSICHPYVSSRAALIERQARNLGDCSWVTLQCRSMGYPVGSAGYLHCRQTFAQEQMARAQADAANVAAAQAAAAAASSPTTCTRWWRNTVTCQ